MDRAKRRRLEYNRDLRWSASLRMGNHWVVDDDGILTVYREGKRGLLVPLPWEPATLEAAANLIEAYLETGKDPSHVVHGCQTVRGECCRCTASEKADAGRIGEKGGNPPAHGGQD